MITGQGDQKREVRIGMITSHSKQIQLDRLTQQNADQAGIRYGFKINFSAGEDGRVYHTELVVGEEVHVGGKDNLKNAKVKFMENTLEGGKNLVVFDADTKENGGGFESSLKRILSTFGDVGAFARL